MITLKNIKWSNVFSYGENNELDLVANKISQIVGPNGSGKSNIKGVIEEALHNNNSKGQKRAKVFNRYTNSKKYTIEINFDNGLDDFIVKTKRSGDSLNIQLLRNGEDISAHTSTNTLKLIQDILGIDFKTFTQLVTQSSANSLEFLKATDSVRKKFLIDLFKLNNYLTLGDSFKELLRAESNEATKLTSKIDTIKSWIKKSDTQDLTIKVELPLPDKQELQNWIIKKEQIETTLKSIDKLNSKISQNLTYKSILDSIDLTLVINVSKPDNDLNELLKQEAVLQAEISKLKSAIKNINLIDTCKACGTKLDITTKLSAVESYKTDLEEVQTKLTQLSLIIDKCREQTEKYNKANSLKNTWENYHNLYDPELQTELHDSVLLNKELASINLNIKNRTDEISKVEAHNTKVTSHNASVKVLLTHREEYKSELNYLENELEAINDLTSVLTILVKTFSTSGLVAYKLESLTKSLEDLVNEYLSELSDGQFQLSFQIVANDKLSVTIIDNGEEVSIEDLSQGELARVNISTLLAIRKMMQNTSSTRMNLLFLDETIDNLDIHGKEKLIEVLLNEPELNTFIVSHGFSHPLLHKINIVKENKISRME